MVFYVEIEMTCQRIGKERTQAMTHNFNQQSFGNQNIREQAVSNENVGNLNLVEQNLAKQAFVNQNVGNQVRKRPQNQLEDNKNRSLANLVLPQLEDFNLTIMIPQILVTNIELKLVMFKMLQSVRQVNGLPSEDPHIHLLNCVTICDSYNQY